VTTLDLRALLAALNDHSVRYVVIGGVAVGAHGYVRATADLDIVPQPTPENATRLAIALHALDATLPLSSDRPFDPAADGAHLRERRNVTVVTRWGALDIVQDARECLPSSSSTARPSIASYSVFRSACARSPTCCA
jgi:hypothetical protein